MKKYGNTAQTFGGGPFTNTYINNILYHVLILL